MSFWLNGGYCDGPDAIDVMDRGFLLGDGVFETVLMVDGVPAFWDAHTDRLKGALSYLKFSIEIDKPKLLAAACELAVRNGLSTGRAALRLTVSRGVGPRGLSIPKSEDQRPSILMTIAAAAPPRLEPLRIVPSRYVRSEASVSARFKTVNYIDNIMARDEAAASGGDEAIMLNSSGRVACASTANVFIVTGAGEVVTPPVGEGALPGIVRGVLLAEAEAFGAPVMERPIELAQLQKSEIILTNSLVGLCAAYLADEQSINKPPMRFMNAAQLRYNELLVDDLERRAQQL